MSAIWDVISGISALLSLLIDAGIIVMQKKKGNKCSCGQKAILGITIIGIVIAAISQIVGVNKGSTLGRVIHAENQDGNQLIIDGDGNDIDSTQTNINPNINIQAPLFNNGDYFPDINISIGGGSESSEDQQEQLDSSVSDNQNGSGSSSQEKTSTQYINKASDNFDDLIYGWNNEGEPRRDYTIEELNGGILGDKIVFNSIGDESLIGTGNVTYEKNFVAARIDNGRNLGESNIWSDRITAEEGKTYYIRLYVHNNSPKAYDAISEDTRVRFDIPPVAAKNIVVKGLITSANAEPSWYSDTVVFQADRPFYIAYDLGSAFLENNGFSPDGKSLSDDIINEPTLIGYDKLDGSIPGCYQYSAYITIRVKPVFVDNGNVSLVNDSPSLIDPKDVFFVDMKVWDGEKWVYELPNDVTVGDRLFYMLTYINKTNRLSDNIQVKISHHDCLRIIDDTTELCRLDVDKQTMKNGIDVEGLKIGTYKPDESVSIIFQAEVIDNALPDNGRSLYCTGQIQDGNTILSDRVNVKAVKD